MSGNPSNSAQKRANEDEPPLVLAEAPHAKKRRQSSKRVSFGGEQIKLFDSNESIVADFSPDLPRRPSEGRRNASPHPIARRGLAFDDEGGDETVTMSGVPPRTSAVYDFHGDIFDRDRPPTRFSVIHGDGDTTLHNRFSMDAGLSSPSSSSPDDITLKLSPAGGLDYFSSHAADNIIGAGMLDSAPRSHSRFEDSGAHGSAPRGSADSGRASHGSAQRQHGSAPQSAPTGSRRLPRQSLPENRQLFSGDNEEDDDVTIHYNDGTPSARKPPTGILKKPSRSMPAPELISLKSPIARPSIARPPVSTPQSVLGSKIRAAAHEISSTRPITIEHSISEATQASPASAHTSHALRVNKFLDAAGVGLHFNVTRGSVTPTKSRDDDFNMSSLDGQIAACFTKKAVVDELEAACVGLQRDIEGVHVELDKLSISIEHSPPDIVLKVSDEVSTSPGARNVIQTGLKRLRRQATMNAGLDWVRGREERELRIEHNIAECNKMLDEDVRAMSSIQAALLTQIEATKEKLHAEYDTGIPPDVDDLAVPIDTALAGKLQAALANSLTAHRRLQESKSKEEVLSDKAQELLSANRNIEKKCEDAQRYLASGSAAKLEASVADARWKNRLFEYMCGISTRTASTRMLDLRLCGIADVLFRLDGNAVTTIDVQPVVCDDIPGSMREFLCDVVTRCGTSIEVRSTKDIAIVVHLLVSYLTLARQACVETAVYGDAHDIELLDAPSGKSCDLVVNVRYSNLVKRIKFAAVFNVRHYAPVFDGDLARLGFSEVVVSSVEGIIGSPPDVDVVKKVVGKVNGFAVKMEAVGQLYGRS